MIRFPMSTQKYADDYRKAMKEMKEWERVSPKQYGEYLQKKRKRGKRK